MEYTKAQIKAIKDQLNPVDVEEAYREALADIYGMVNICGMEMSQARILEEMDNTAFRCGCNDWVDAEISNGTLTDEIDGEYYNQTEVDELIENLETEE